MQSPLVTIISDRRHRPPEGGDKRRMMNGCLGTDILSRTNFPGGEDVTLFQSSPLPVKSFTGGLWPCWLALWGNFPHSSGPVLVLSFHTVSQQWCMDIMTE